MTHGWDYKHTTWDWIQIKLWSWLFNHSKGINSKFGRFYWERYRKFIQYK